MASPLADCSESARWDAAGILRLPLGLKPHLKKSGQILFWVLLYNQDTSLLLLFFYINLFCPVSYKRKLRRTKMSLGDSSLYAKTRIDGAKAGWAEWKNPSLSQPDRLTGTVGAQRRGSHSCFLLSGDSAISCWSTGKMWKTISQCLLSTLCSWRKKVTCNLCKILLELGLRILVIEPSMGEKPLFICYGPCLGSENAGRRETGYKRVPTLWGSKDLGSLSWLSPMLCI